MLMGSGGSRFSIVAGTFGVSPVFVGFQRGTAGSISPSDAKIKGAQVNGFYSVTPVVLSYDIRLAGILPQNYFTSASFIGQTFLTSAASVSSSDGDTIWTWVDLSGAMFIDGQTYPVTWT